MKYFPQFHEQLMVGEFVGNLVGPSVGDKVGTIVRNSVGARVDTFLVQTAPKTDVNNLPTGIFPQVAASILCASKLPSSRV